MTYMYVATYILYILLYYYITYMVLDMYMYMYVCTHIHTSHDNVKRDRLQDSGGSIANITSVVDEGGF
jgi:hypothetical protein